MADNQILLDSIKAAQSAPAADYAVVAELRPNDPKAQIVLSVARVAKTLVPEVLAQRLDYEARRRLVEIHCGPDEVASAKIFLSPLPDARAAVDPIIDRRAQDDDAPIVLDFLYWEGLRAQAGLTAVREGIEEVLTYRGVTVLRSGAG